MPGHAERGPDSAAQNDRRLVVRRDVQPIAVEHGGDNHVIHLRHDRRFDGLRFFYSILFFASLRALSMFRFGTSPKRDSAVFVLPLVSRRPRAGRSTLSTYPQVVGSRSRVREGHSFIRASR